MSVTMVTAGGYKVSTVSTTDKGSWFRVTHPQGFTVTLEPWKGRNSPEIRTAEQLTAVLAREGQDIATLKEM